ncbi:MAG: PepSY domain-containing protein [Clostridia bacterium]|nr:PepSY domain-containing protein [Clostridia bacterium]MBR6620469.1 PepSY domain-containing protein [Clostridia bacterium]
MKKKILTALISAGLFLSVITLAGCTDNKSQVEEKATVNQAQASAPEVNNEELTSINPDAAIDAALKHAGIAREDAVLYGTPSLDKDDGKAHYDIKFSYDKYEYEYEIAVADGAVLKAEKEAEKIDVPVTVKDKTTEKSKAPEKNEAPVSKENTTKKNSNNNNNGYISVEAAKKKALDNAGVKAEDAVFLKAYYDYDDLVPHYEIKFEANGYEYEYEIKAADGAIIDKDVERERNPVKATSAASDYISADKAKSLAYNHAKVKAADVKYSKAELDRDDMVVHYDVEFVAGKYEYEYEINAETGKVIAYDKDFND